MQVKNCRSTTKNHFEIDNFYFEIAKKKEMTQGGQPM